jgi:hypothetical protein
MSDQLVVQYRRDWLLADYAHEADQDYEDCCACLQPMRRGQRIARLLTGDWAHCPCVASQQPPPAREHPPSRPRHAPPGRTA